jgi:hypothetical protein
MPAQSNLFQRLVLEIHRGLGAGWDVRESRSLTDAITGEPREMDIVAEGKVYGYGIIMSVEVCDRGRAPNVTWVEGLAKKHESLPTDKLVLWSLSGLTEPAARKAAALKIAVVTPADQAPWASLAKRVRNSVAQLVVSNLTSVMDVRLSDGTLARWEAPPETLLNTRDGTRCFSIARLQQTTKEHEMFGKVMLDNAPDGVGQFHAVFNPPEPCTVTSPKGIVGEVLRVFIDIKTQCQHSPLEVRSALHNDEVTTLAEAQLLGGVFQLLVHEPQNGQTTMVATHTRRGGIHDLASVPQGSVAVPPNAELPCDGQARASNSPIMGQRQSIA